jgi:hypothetical protein
MTNVQKAYDAVYRNNEFSSNLVVSSLNYDFDFFLDMAAGSGGDGDFLLTQFGDGFPFNAYGIMDTFG